MNSVEDEFASGPWTGFYVYAGGRKEPMDLTLSFRDGLVDGSGADPVGDFVLRGRYDPSSRDVWWTKSYLGRHAVFYKGCRDVHGIWGTWEISPSWRGGFHIWPKGHGSGDHAEAEAGIESPTETSRK